MGEARRTRLAELPHRIREWMARWPADLRDWRADLRHDPGLLWRTPVIRVGLFMLGGVALIAGARWLAVALVPGGATAFEQATPYAILYVACTDPACRASYTTQQPRDLRNWPLVCEKCGKKAVYRAQVCPDCGGWFATAPGRSAECQFCEQRRAATRPATDVQTKPINPDDAEDPWK